MPMQSITLRPGVNTQKTLSENEAGISVANLIRYKDSNIQKLGGWDLYYALSFNSTIRDIHAWQGVASDKHLAVGTTGSSVNGGGLNIITSGSNSDITPQTRTSNFTPQFSVSSGSNVVTVVDANSSASVFDTIFFNTPVALGNLLLNGAYKVNTAGGSSTYTIISSNIASTTIASSGILPVFTTATGSPVVQVDLPNNQFQQVTGLFYGFYAPTTVAALTIQGPYQVSSITDSTRFQITANQQSSAVATVTMNNGLAQLVYYVALGPPAAASGYGIGGYGLGGYGIGSPVQGGQGTPINATDWTMDNWGEILLACPKDGPIYTWSPDSGFTTASVVTTAPFFNGGIFVSMPQQILVAWRSCLPTGVQVPLIVKWSDAGDYTNWTDSNQTAAGDFTIPTGSQIVGGLQGPTQALIWTDIDAWAMQYVGGDVIFNFNRVGTGCGLVGPHACGVIGGQFFWAGASNFYTLGANGVVPLQCTVWDFVFQNLDTTNQYKIICAPNSTFNEIAWYFPVVGGTGENTAYVKYNVIEGEWDYGFLPRSAWSDVTILGTPIGTDTTTVYQHEMGNDAVNLPINGSFTSGWFSISDGNELCFVDWIIPDMKFGTYSGAKTATLTMTFQAVDYPGDVPRTYGPFTYTKATEYITTRIRGRLMNVTVQSNDTGSFWRLGKIRYRYAPAGRR